MYKKFNIIIYNGDFNLPPFIKSQVKYLEKQGHSLYVMGESEHFFPIKKGGITYIPECYPVKNFNTIFKVFWALTRFLAFKPLQLIYYLRLYRKDYGKNPDKGRFFYFQDIVRISYFLTFRIEIIHLNWGTAMPRFAHLFPLRKFRFVCSFWGRIENIALFVNPTVRRIYERHLQYLDGYHAISQELANNVATTGISRQTIHVFHSPIESELLKESRFPKQNTTLKISTVSRPHWKKGLDIALKGMAILKQKGYVFEYQIIGGGDNQELRMLIDKLQLNDYVRLEGAVDHKKALNTIQQSDLFLLPSVEEGIANVVLEAMAFETPILTADLDGMTEIIQHGVNGWVFQKRNFQDISNKVDKFWRTNEEEKREIVKNAKSYVQKHTWSQDIVKFQNLYESTMKMS